MASDILMTTAGSAGMLHRITSTQGDGSLRWPGIEPGSTAWKAAMLTTIPPMHV